MKIVFSEKKPEPFYYAELRTGDLFKFPDKKYIYLRVDDGYINLDCGSGLFDENEGDKPIIRLEGKLTVWEI